MNPERTPPAACRVVTFGVNRVDRAAADYGGWEGALQGCCGDASAIITAGAQAGAAANGYMADYFGTMTTFGSVQPDYRLIGDATRSNFRQIFDDMSAQPDVKLWFAWLSMHGSQTRYLMETVEGLCFFDGIMEDRELWSLLQRVPSGVRFFLGLDTCHAGGMPGTRTGPFNQVKSCPLRFRGVGLPPPLPNRSEFAGEICVFAGCKKNQLSLDGRHNGLFTATALSVLKPETTYLDWPAAVQSQMPPEQQPEMIFYGPQGAAAWTRRSIFL